MQGAAPAQLLQIGSKGSAGKIHKEVEQLEEECKGLEQQLLGNQGQIMPQWLRLHAEA